MHILFGNLLGVAAWDIVETIVLGGTCLVFVVLRRRDLLLMSFDPVHARVVGLATGFLHYGLLTALAMTIVVSLKAVGVILVVAMLIAPGATAYLATDRFERMLVVAIAVSVFATVSGTFISFHLDAATGACIVLIQAAVFVGVLLLAPKKGLLRTRAVAA
jgi:manganese/iron transport system permease protein